MDCSYIPSFYFILYTELLNVYASNRLPISDRRSSSNGILQMGSRASLPESWSSHLNYRKVKMTRSDPSNPFQRQILFDRKTSASAIQGRLVSIVHGSLRDKDDPQDLATLVILEFVFQSLKSSQRIRSARIKFDFADADLTSKTRSHPEVYKLAPLGHGELVR